MSRFFYFVLIAAVLLEACPATAAPGDIDISFGSNGQARIAANVDASFSGKGALIVEPNGSVVVAGLCGNPGSTAAVCLARVLVDGAIDSTFGSNGLAIGPSGASDKATTGLARQSDGKFVVSSICEDLTGYFGCARRFTATGGIDSTFGSNGAAKLAHPEWSLGESAQAISANRDGTLTVMGQCGYPIEGAICLVRLLANGQPDASYGSNGYITVSLGPTVRDFYNGIEFNPLPDGKTLVSSLCDLATGEHYCIAQITADGLLDPSFNSAGVLPGLALKPRTVNYNASVKALARRGDASLMLAVACQRFSPGFGPDELCLESFTAAGGIDSNFGSAGERRIPPSNETNTLFPSQLLSSADGRMLVSGRCGTTAPALPCINRYRADGTLDTSFTPVLLSTTPAPYPDSSGLGVQVSGKIIFGGACNGTATGFCITRIQGGPFDYARCSADVDGDGAIDAKDALLLARVAIGFRGAAVTQNVAFAAHATRSTWPAIRDYLFNQCGMQVSP